MKIITDKSVISKPIHESESMTFICLDRDLIVDAPINLTKGNLFFLARHLYCTQNANITIEKGDITFQTTGNIHVGGSQIKSGRNMTVESHESLTIESNIRNVLLAEIKQRVPKINP